MDLEQLKIYQIYYLESQIPSLDNAFIPYNNANKSYPLNYEFAVFFDLFKSTDWSKVQLLGTVSWKFFMKTGLKGSEFVQHIRDNPGYDVYFVNPFPDLSVYRSVWDQGDEFHPYLSELTKILLVASGLNPKIIDLETAPNLSAYCNYWVANQNFWSEYIEFLKPVWNYIHTHNNSLIDALKLPADPFIKAPYLPFIFERFFSTFLMVKRFKVSSFPINETMYQPILLAPDVRRNVRRINLQTAHDEIRMIDKKAIRLYLLIKKMRYYTAPLLYRKTKAWINGRAFQYGLTASKCAGLKEI